MNISKTGILAYTALLVVVLFFSVTKFNENFQEYKTNYAAKNEAKAQVDDLRLQLDTITQAAAQRAQSNVVLKPFFQQEYAPQDSIASFGGMFEDVVDYVKINGLMLRSIQYTINPPDDLIYTNFGSSYNTCAVHLFVIGTYKQFQGFINSINDYPYYMNIASIEVSPYQNNKAYLLCRVSINLYSKK